MRGSRKKVIETAQRLMRERGYKATGIKEILEQSRVSRSNFYYHFTSKRQLAEAVIAVWKDNLQCVFSSIVEQDLTYRQQIELFVQIFIDTQTHDAFTVCPFGRLAIELGNSEPTLHKLVNQVFTEFHMEVSRLIQLGIDNGEFKQETDAEMLSNALLVAIQGGIILSHAHGNAKAMAETCRYILDNA